jgi:hypothetical protein
MKLKTSCDIARADRNTEGRRKINKVIANDDYNLTITFDIKNRKLVVSTKMT